MRYIAFIGSLFIDGFELSTCFFSWGGVGENVKKKNLDNIISFDLIYLWSYSFRNVYKQVFQEEKTKIQVWTYFETVVLKYASKM